LMKYDHFIKPLAIVLVPLGLLTLFVRFSKIVMPHCRQILELAARPVVEMNDGFTPRPFPAGSVNYTREEILGFAKYLGKQLIAINYLDEDRVFLVIEANEMNLIKLRKPDFQRETYISVDFSGNVSVNIAKKDYNKYKDELTFDQLCTSLADLFKTFLYHYVNGEPHKIMEIIADKRTVSAELKKSYVL